MEYQFNLGPTSFYHTIKHWVCDPADCSKLILLCASRLGLPVFELLFQKINT